MTKIIKITITFFQVNTKEIELKAEIIIELKNIKMISIQTIIVMTVTLIMMVITIIIQLIMKIIMATSITQKRQCSYLDQCSA